MYRKLCRAQLHFSFFYWNMNTANIICMPNNTTVDIFFYTKHSKRKVRAPDKLLGTRSWYCSSGPLVVPDSACVIPAFSDFIAGPC
jgi:hypothetical protein